MSEPEQGGEVSKAAEALTPPHSQLALGKLVLSDLNQFYSKAKRHCEH